MCRYGLQPRAQADLFEGEAGRCKGQSLPRNFGIPHLPHLPTTKFCFSSDFIRFILVILENTEKISLLRKIISISSMEKNNNSSMENNKFLMGGRGVLSLLATRVVSTAAT